MSSDKSLIIESWKMEGGLHVQEIEEMQRSLVDICTICQGSKDSQYVILYCNHTYCHGCFRTFLQSGANWCPNCRAILDEYIVVSTDGVWEGNAGYKYPDIIEL